MAYLNVIQTLNSNVLIRTFYFEHFHSNIFILTNFSSQNTSQISPPYSACSSPFLFSIIIQPFCLSVFKSAFLSLSLSYSLSSFLSFCSSVFVSFYISVDLSFFLSVLLSSCHSIFLFICLSVYLSFCLSVFLSFCLSVFLSSSHYLVVFLQDQQWPVISVQSLERLCVVVVPNKFEERKKTSQNILQH